MQVRRLISWALLTVTTVLGVAAEAQTTAGSGTVVVLPLSAFIPGAYTTTVFVRNPNSIQITLNVRYYQSDNATPPGGGTSESCQQLIVQPFQAITFDLGSQCTFTGTDNFGIIILEDVTSQYKTNTFFAYSRTESPTGNGFSVEGFPVGNFSGAPANALGLKRTTLSPHYKSNCFVGALGEPVSYQLRLFQGETGVPIGNPINGSLLAYHTTRLLDVFAAAGAAAGNYSNVRASFSNVSGNPAFIAFCTLETTDNGSADFRVAKSDNALDNRQTRLACFGQDSCGAGFSSSTDPAQLGDVTKRNIHYLILDQPDFVKCDLVSDQINSRLADLQIVLRPPGDALGTTPFALSAPYNSPPFTSGGAGQTGFYIYTGEKSTVGGGSTTRWYIDVSFRPGGNTAVPINYGITCRSGNGVTVPWLGATAPLS